ncbi:MAG: ATP-binding protein [Clostridiales bacterium]|nr:ATP-binding protein [Clostridiales bacterium]
MAFPINRGIVPTAKKVVIYGPEGIGKTTFAARFPNPVFIDTEGSTKEYDVARFPAPTSWQMLLDEVAEVKKNPQICRTLVIDTADWAESACFAHVISTGQVKSIEDFGYGKGYARAKEEFGKLLNELTEVVNAGVNVVVTAHAAMRKFEQPDEMGSYDRWEMKLYTSQKTNIAALLKEWADMVLFANYKTFAVKDKNSNKAKAQGGQRVMYTTHHPCWDAKNRYGLPEILPLDYEGIREVIETGPADQQEKDIQVISQGSIFDHHEDVPAKSTAQEAPKANKSTKKPEAKKEEPAAPVGFDVDPAIPKNLRDLMIADGVTEWDIQNLMSVWGYVDSQMPVREYTKIVNDGVSIIDGFLVPQWADIRKEIQKMNDTEEIPFN